MLGQFARMGSIGRPSVSAAIRALFSSSEPGAWYDPSDMSTLFQDSAGTVPVTAVEQPVGRILDKSGRGNHATQSTTTKRPVLSRRVNMLTKTEEMTPVFATGVGWTHGAFGNWVLSLDLGAQLAPDGENTAAGIRSVGAGGVSTSVQRVNVAPGASIVFRVWVKKVEGEDQSGLAGLRLIFQTGNNGALVDPYAASVAIGESVTDAWQQFEFSYTTPATGVNQVEAGIWFASVAPAAVAVWGASLTLATDAHLPYQRVNTGTDYDADPAKFPAYLSFDGVDDALQTGNIDFTSTDKMTAWAGITKLSDAATGALIELSVNSSITAGTVMIRATDYPGGNEYTAYARGASAYVGVIAGVDAAPSTRMLTAKFDLAAATGQQVIARLNGVNGGAAATNTGGGSFINAPFHIGARAGTSHFFNGRLYSLIVRGAQSSLSQIEATELYIKQKMRMP